MSDTLSSAYNDDGFSASPQMTFLFVSDFHETLYHKDSGLDVDYFKALLAMRAAGYEVVIASDLAQKAIGELLNCEAAHDVLVEFGLVTDVERETFIASLFIAEKKNLFLMGLKKHATPERPYIICDDQAMVRMFACNDACYLHPSQDPRFEKFVQDAIIDPYQALSDLSGLGGWNRASNDAEHKDLGLE